VTYALLTDVFSRLVASSPGLAPQPVPTFAYDASKAALHHLTKKLATELAPRHITVNAIAPYARVLLPNCPVIRGFVAWWGRSGFVPSKMSKQLLTYATKEQIEKAIPLGRWGTAEDLGGATIFLSSRAGTIVFRWMFYYKDVSNRVFQVRGSLAPFSPLMEAQWQNRSE
jgi:NAD(P)-dependent dehydrogenase (short-subunit alcohol dehydrogenase family)